MTCKLCNQQEMPWSRDSTSVSTGDNAVNYNFKNIDNLRLVRPLLLCQQLHYSCPLTLSTLYMLVNIKCFWCNKASLWRTFPISKFCRMSMYSEALACVRMSVNTELQWRNSCRHRSAHCSMSSTNNSSGNYNTSSQRINFAVFDGFHSLYQSA